MSNPAVEKVLKKKFKGKVSEKDYEEEIFNAMKDEINSSKEKREQSFNSNDAIVSNQASQMAANQAMQQQYYQQQMQQQTSQEYEFTPYEEVPSKPNNDAEKIHQEQEYKKEELEEKKQEAARDKEKQEESIAQVKERRDEQIAKINAEEDEAMAELENGRSLPFYMLIFTSPLFFLATMVLDSIIATIPVAGDFISFIVLAIIWAIPCVLIMSRKAYIGILSYLLFDLIFGLTAGSLGNIIPFAGEAVIDAIPEVLIILASLVGSKK